MKFTISGGLKTFFNLVNKLTFTAITPGYLWIQGKDGELYFSSSDGESIVKVKMGYDGEVGEFITAIALNPLKPLIDDGLSGALFELNDNKLVISMANRQYTFDTLTPMEMNLDTSDAEEYLIDYDGLQILEVMSKLAEGDIVKPMFNGVNVKSNGEKIIFQASFMGYTFHLAEIGRSIKPFEFIVPKKFISLVSVLAKESLDAQIIFGYNKKVFTFITDEYEIISRALTYSFPQINDATFGKYAYSMSIGVKQLAAAVNRCGNSASIFAGTFTNTKLKIDRNYITVSEHMFAQAGNFRLQEKVSYEADSFEPCEFVLSPRLIKQTLSVNQGVDVLIRYSPGAPAVCFQDRVLTHYIAVVRA